MRIIYHMSVFSFGKKKELTVIHLARSEKIVEIRLCGEMSAFCLLIKMIT
jgi:hypothetical protein